MYQLFCLFGSSLQRCTLGNMKKFPGQLVKILKIVFIATRNLNHSFLINIKCLLPSMFSLYRPMDLYFLHPLIKEKNHYRSMRQGLVGSNPVTAEIHYLLSFREFHQWWQDLKQYRVIPSISLQKHLSLCKQDNICTISKGAINYFFFLLFFTTKRH